MQGIDDKRIKKDIDDKGGFYNSNFFPPPAPTLKILL
jgi:hypothetical protein